MAVILANECSFANHAQSIDDLRAELRQIATRVMQPADAVPSLAATGTSSSLPRAAGLQPNLVTNSGAWAFVIIQGWFRLPNAMMAILRPVGHFFSQIVPYCFITTTNICLRDCGLSSP